LFEVLLFELELLDFVLVLDYYGVFCSVFGLLIDLGQDLVSFEFQRVVELNCVGFFLGFQL
jgi:hypothetical protein